MAEHESADESVAAELADLLPRLPRVKITPQTISQNIIDRWYGYETEYRQTIAELRAELVVGNERVEKAKARLATQVGNVRELAAELDRLRAQLAKIGEAREEWGTRWEGHERVESFGYGPDAEALARENTHPRDTLMRRVVSKWKAADGA